MSSKQTAKQPSTNEIDMTAHHLSTGKFSHSAKAFQTNTMDAKAQQPDVDRTNLAVVSEDTTNVRSHKRSADQAFSAGLPNERGHSTISAKVPKMTETADEGNNSRAGININEPTVGLIGQVNLELDGDQAMEGVVAQEVNEPMIVPFGLDGIDDAQDQSHNHTVSEPSAFDAALASHALTAISILRKYTDPRLTSSLDDTFQSISQTIEGATRVPSLISQAQFVTALSDAQVQLEALAVRKNSSITEMQVEEQELSSMGLSDESAELMGAISNAHRLLSTMRREYEQLDLM